METSESLNCGLRLPGPHEGCLSSGTQPSSQSRIGSIDSLRGLAALMVVIYHARSEVWVGTSYFWQIPSLRFTPSAIAGYLSVPFSFGFLGVQLLFVISGYCIHRTSARKLAEGKEYRLSLRAYFARRFWRIYPTLLAALALTWLVDFLSKASSNASLPAHSDSAFTALANLLALQGLVAPSFGSNGVLWSLGLEIQFFLFYPLLLFVRRRIGTYRTLSLILAISIGSSLAVSALHLKKAFPFWEVGCPLFVIYWFTWVCGFFIAEAEFNLVELPAYLSLAGFLSIVLAFILRHYQLQPLDEVPFGIAMAAILAANVMRRKSKSLLSKFLAFLGVCSYSIYITHRPIIALLKSSFPQVSRQHLSLSTPYAVTAICLLVGWLFYQFVECWSLHAKPFQTLVLKLASGNPIQIEA